MDIQALKKKLSVYRDADGCFKNLSNEILYELLVGWENWEGSPASFYSGLGTNFKQMAGVIGKAKRYKREGKFGSADFKEVVVEGSNSNATARTDGCQVIEFVWPDGRMVRFSEVDKLLDFIKRSA